MFIQSLNKPFLASIDKLFRPGDSGGSRRGSLEPPPELNYFIFMENFRKNEAKRRKRTPF